MSKLQVRRLLVLNREKRLVGVVALSDLAPKQDAAAVLSALKGVCQPNPPRRSMANRMVANFICIGPS